MVRSWVTTPNWALLRDVLKLAGPQQLGA